ncbi:pseudouridine synthase deg1 [Tieghemiomyces parasiticus]|uniref:Pseudouridine synthase deg1 n=1 Tax=Tieghemiomyces parasiticus TaxID=78921 RepID=A0A9W8A7E7_9FUNG|nr:pseudouridine synthase deg1 [Tieghemiomyces parasiticus]
MSSPPQPPRAEDYEKWSKADLIARIAALESQSTQSDTHVSSSSQQQIATNSTTAAPVLVATTAATLAAVDPDTTAAPPVAQPTGRRKQRDFDWSKYSKRRICLKVAYFGWDYFGFATQGDDHPLPTVEAKLFQSLKKCRLVEGSPSQCRYTRCGRTDRGVSGLGQVIALDVRSSIPAQYIGQVLGGVPRSSPATVGDDADQLEADAVEESAAAENNHSQSAPQNLVRYWKPATDLGLTAIPSESQRALADRAADANQGTEVADGSYMDEATLASYEARELPYIRMLNQDLPADIRIIAWAPVDRDFNARFDCVWRHYKYFFSDQGYPRLDVTRMREGARRFLGLHDFRYFCKIDPAKEITNYERTVLEIDITPVNNPSGSASAMYPAEVASEGADGNDKDRQPLNRPPQFYQLDLRGSAFLWHQVRCMVGTLLLVGQGLEEPTLIDRLLTVDPDLGRPAYPMASELPLILYDCYYHPAPAWRYNDADGRFQSLRATHQRLSELYDHHTIKALTARAAISMVDQVPLPVRSAPSEKGDPAENGTPLTTTTPTFGTATEQQVLDAGIHLVTLANLGGGTQAASRRYTPVMERDRQNSVDVANERFQVKKKRLAEQKHQAGGKVTKAPPTLPRNFVAKAQQAAKKRSYTELEDATLGDSGN